MGPESDCIPLTSRYFVCQHGPHNAPGRGLFSAASPILSGGVGVPEASYNQARTLEIVDQVVPRCFQWLSMAGEGSFPATK